MSNNPHTFLFFKIVIAILIFITSGFTIFVIIRYIIITTYSVEQILNYIELSLNRGNSPIINSISSIISRVSSPSSVDIALESGIINVIPNTPIPNSPVPSSNIIHNTTTYLLNHPMINPPINQDVNIHNTTTSLLNHPMINPPINQDLNTSVETPIHPRVVIVCIIGFGIFLGVNISVDFYLFLATPCC
jgi:hypothetical protein